jgi:hypothetical protein
LAVKQIVVNDCLAKALCQSLTGLVDTGTIRVLVQRLHDFCAGNVGRENRVLVPINFRLDTPQSLKCYLPCFGRFGWVKKQQRNLSLYTLHVPHDSSNVRKSGTTSRLSKRTPKGTDYKWRNFFNRGFCTGDSCRSPPPLDQSPGKDITVRHRHLPV